ncbi:uncharacterized protein LOC110858416 [Folsomia candida]|uniref:Uncharacterized protein n=1 Tax=Folsomia candida TaxID=158441 RepID=A0A226DFU6_FOLCA|nr:uncharacterized protein LOC110858416 [Folsomia candida]OXA43858.1 hypothetical protein Fcan01_21546 [Folsomia candida]
MEGSDSFSDDDDFVTTQKRTRRRATPEVVEKKAKLVKAGPSTSAAKSKPSTTKTATALPDPSKHLAVETTRAANCAEGELNPRGTKDKEKRKSETATSLVREDQNFLPVPWSYILDEEEMEVEEEEMRLRDGRGIIHRAVELAEEFHIKYVGSSDVRLGTTVKGEGVDQIRKTILRLVGVAQNETTSSDLDVFEASPELVSTQEEQGLTAGQREVLFQEIFGRGGRVDVEDKPGWFLIIHKAPTTGLIHLCLEVPQTNRGVLGYIAIRLCTKPKCYQYSQTLSSDVLPKCAQHQPNPIFSVVEMTDYNRRDVLVLLHMKLAFSVVSNASKQMKDEKAELMIHHLCTGYTQWANYCTTSGLQTRPIPKSISRHHFNNEGEALRMLSFESTIGMFIKLASGSQPIINLDDLIPLCYGMEGEIDARLKELGIELKVRRHLTKDEKAGVKYPFPGEYLLGTAAAAQQQPAKGNTFLYTIMSRNMWYFGWSNTPDFKHRFQLRAGTDGAREYKRITEKRQKDRELEIEGLRQRDRELGRAEDLCIYPPPLKAPTMTPYLVANCEDDDKKNINTKTIEAKMIIAGYVAYLLGLRNPIRPNSDVGYSTNKCSLVDSNSWGEICEFVKLFWGFEPMLGKLNERN